MTWTRRARTQHGLITRRQLDGYGMGPAEIHRMLTRTRLETTDSHGVFRVAGAPLTAESAVWEAVLRTGSPVSYLSAAQLWGIDVPSDGVVHVTRVDRKRLDWPAGVRVHRVELRDGDVSERHGLPVTVRTETILDCLGYLRLGDARRLADRCEQQGLLRADDILRRLRDRPRRWGNTQLRRLVPQFGDGAAAESERRLHRLLRAHAITGWTANLRVIAGGRRYEIDVAFPSRLLAIEVDGFDYHRRDRFQSDRTRQNALIAAGWTVLRFTWNDLEDRPQYVVDAIASALAA